ncbi:glutamate--cysteine ligase [Arthrobacter crystallopoietes]|uniref:glutamate--cysteine ligase n=1 Tax=Crystallibacter crystallopoietes TaxID=37928 RepID=UPI001F0EFEB1|nr:glutamate--cysteine ligase [Arthrobacter crystallopoietes]
MVKTKDMRSFGVEEELLLVDAKTGALAPVSEQLLGDNHQAGPSTPGIADSPIAYSGALVPELKQEQLEAVSAPYKDLRKLAAGLRAGRAEADRQAKRFGARAVALGTYPLPAATQLVRRPRYQAMEGRYGMTLREQLTCGFHIHVGVASDDEAVAVLDRIRVWLPVLLALSGNSPYWQGADSGYASFRYQVWKRWPTAGPTELFGSASAYHSLVRVLLDCDVLLDEGMVYFDARLSRRQPTVEIRVADVCLEADHAAALAGICRALVETAAREWLDGRPPLAVPTELLRLASWRASKSAVADDLIHPLRNGRCPARAAVGALLKYVGPVLAETGDLEPVKHLASRIVRTGTGADRQRAVFARHSKLTDVVFDAVRRTHLPATYL